MAQILNDNDHDIVATHTIQCLDHSVSHLPTLSPPTLLTTAQILCDNDHDIMMMRAQQDSKTCKGMLTLPTC